MKYNVIKTKEELKKDIENMKELTEIKINIVGRMMSITKYYKGYTLWWGGNYGIDCFDADDVIDKIDMLTSFIIEGEMNKNECFVTKKTERFMKESANA